MFEHFFHGNKIKMILLLCIFSNFQVISINIIQAQACLIYLVFYHYETPSILKNSFILLTFSQNFFCAIYFYQIDKSMSNEKVLYCDECDWSNFRLQKKQNKAKFFSAYFLKLVREFSKYFSLFKFLKKMLSI